MLWAVCLLLVVYVVHYAFFHPSLTRDGEGNVLEPWQLSELLMDLGAMSVSVDDAAKGTDEEIPLLRDHIATQVCVPVQVLVLCA